MTWNNCSIIHEGNNISDLVINYDREKSICAGTSSLTLTVQWIYPHTFTSWDEIVLNEEGSKVGTFLIVSTEKQHDGNLRIICQDYSKKLTDWFVEETYPIPDFSYTRTWIEFFLDMANISYDINVDGNGVYINNNTVFGRQMIFDIVQSLLQMSGWYMYFDPDGTCVIQAITKDLSNPDYTFQDHQIEKIQVNTSDKSLRNRAVVWGLVSPDENKRVSADITVQTPWNTSEFDKRAICMSNSYIRNSSVAKSLARKLLDNFAELNVEKIISFVNNHNFEVGQIVQIESEYFSGIGLITTVQSSMSASGGLVSTIILDQKCPRLFGYFGYIVPVYIGTDGQGVWRKPLDSGLWENYSYGLFANPINPGIPGIDINEVNPTEGVVTDLIIKSGVFACVNGYWGYYNIGHTTANWKKLDPLTVTDLNNISFTMASLQAAACDLDPVNNRILIGYKLRDSAKEIIGEQRSWIIEYSTKGKKLAEYFISFSDTKQDFELVDIDAYTSSRKIATTICPASYDTFWGDRKVSHFGSYGFFGNEVIPDKASYSFGIIPDEEIQEGSSDIISHGEAGNYGTIDTITENKTITTFGDTKSFNYTIFNGDIPTSLRTNVKFPYTFFRYNNGSAIGNKILRYVWREEKNDPYSIVDVIYDFRYTTDLKKIYTFLHCEYSPLVYEYPEDFLPYSCRVATTQNITLSGEQVIDGITVESLDYVLVKDQIDKSKNGIYIVNILGNWYRSSFLYTGDEIRPGLFTRVEEGTLYSETCWQTDGSAEGIVGTDNLVFFEVLHYKPIKETSFTLTETVPGVYKDASDIRSVIGTNGNIFIVKKLYTVNSNTVPNTTKDTGAVVYCYSIRDLLLNESEMKASDRDVTGIYDQYIFPPTFITALKGDGIAIPYVYYNANPLYLKYVQTFLADCIIKVGILYVKSNGDKELIEEQIWQWWVPYKELWKELTGIGDSASASLTTFFDAEINGYNTGADIDPIIKFRLRVFQRVRRTGNYCNVKNCSGSTIDTIDTYDLYYGIIGGSYSHGIDGKVQYGIASPKGMNCYCISYAYSVNDNKALNYTFYTAFPLQSKLNNPVYVRNNYIFSPGSFETTSGIQLPLVSYKLSPVMDDIDNSIYAWSTNNYIMYKFSDVVTRTLAQYRLTNSAHPPSPESFIFANGFLMFIYTQGSKKNRTRTYKFAKVNDNIILKNQRVCMMQEINNGSIDVNFYRLKLENSKNSPIVSWTEGNSLLDYQIRDADDNLIDVSSYFPHSYKIYNNLKAPNIVYSQVHDTRTVDLGGYFPVLGEFVEFDYKRYNLGAGNGNKLNLINAYPFDSEEVTPIFEFADVEDINYKIETTNNYGSQYMFTTQSGIGVSGIFFQKNPGALTWIDYSLSLPSALIHVIRCDDLV